MESDVYYNSYICLQRRDIEAMVTMKDFIIKSSPDGEARYMALLDALEHGGIKLNRERRTGGRRRGASGPWRAV